MPEDSKVNAGRRQLAQGRRPADRGGAFEFRGEVPLFSGPLRLC
jgi:hypothetical protein